MMDLTTTIIGLVLVALTVLPIMYFHYAQKNKRAKFLNNFIKEAEQQQIKVSQTEVWSSYCAIGIDTNALKLYYIKKVGEVDKAMQINLAEVEKCRVNITKRELNEDQVIDRLELVFTMRNHKAPEKVLEFFSKDEFMSLNGELQLVEKWKTIINSQLESKQKLAMAV